MTRERSAPTEGDFTRAVLESAMAALPAALRVASCAILLPSAERNAIRSVARRNLTEPQVQALADLLGHPEIGRLLASGRPFLPRSGDGISAALEAQLRADGWPDLIAAPLAGTGRPVGVLCLIPEGEGHWTPARIEAAVQIGALVAASLRAAVRATDGERRRRLTTALLERLPLIDSPGESPEHMLGQVVAGLGAALTLSHCLGVLLSPLPAFLEYCQPGATPVGAPQRAQEHPMWGLLRTGSLWGYDDREASPADRSATARLLGGLTARSLLAAPVIHRGVLLGYLLLVQADRHRHFAGEEQEFIRIAAAELAGAIAGEPETPDRQSGQSAVTAEVAPAQAALVAASTAAETAAALHAALEQAGVQVDAVVLARWDTEDRRLHLLAAHIAGRGHAIDLAAPAPLGEDLLSAVVRDGDPATGGAARALPRQWRDWYRPPRDSQAIAIALDKGDPLLALVVAAEPTLRTGGAVLRTLAPVVALSLSRADLIDRAAKRERRLTALNDVLLATANATDLEDACAAVSEIILRNLTGVDLVTVWLLDQDGQTLQRVSTRSEVVTDSVVQRSMPLERDAGVTHVVRSMANVVWHRDERKLPETLRRFMERANLETLAAVPMRTTVREVSGSISIGSLRRRHYQPEELTFLETLAGQLGSQLDLVQMRQHGEAERRQLRSLVETLPEGLLVMDADSVVRLSSPVAQRILGERLDGRSAREIFEGLRLHYADGRAYTTDDLPFVRVLKGEQASGVEVVLVGSDGAETPLLVNCRPVYDPEQAVSGAICVFQDLTPFQELSTLKSDFVNSVSHELRTPITTIRGGALTLLKRRRFLDEHTQNELLNDIAEEAERLHLLVEDLLSLTRSRSGMNVSPEPVLLHRLINRVIIELGGRVGGHTLRVEISPDLLPVDVDPALATQVVRNLLENAVKFSPRGQEIEIAAEMQDGSIVVSILDRGSGVPSEDLDRVFEPFYRPDSTVRSGAQGAGLGLAVCRRLVEMQGGRIWAETRDGGGAAFRFTLPIAAGAEEE